MFVPVRYAFVWFPAQLLHHVRGPEAPRYVALTSFIHLQPFFSPLSMILLLPADMKEAPQAPLLQLYPCAGV